ncbi:hypothetical protein C7999DRAFT_12841 [Corynascus novoguineensis]|uniref:Uncharacterized protein n=1 Tax=Corynascus novoguineensis TaxID=1126955 RepID=A0AAN7CYL9_9PEZI|nr:hypothetical protein C7999DRAFT_12841 [Corynascus novoguineensis]
MGKETSAFSLPGFICLAPSIYVQDARMNGGAYHADSHASTFSSSSFGLPQGPAAKMSSRSRDMAPPDLIIITSWTGAASKHVAKYTTAYNTLYPGVPILVITTAVSDMVLHSTKHKLKALAPAVTYLLSEEPVYSQHTSTSSTSTFTQPYHYYPNDFNHYPYQQQPPPSLVLPQSIAGNTITTRPRFSSLLLHAFSEGGAHKAVLLARAFLSTTTTTTTTTSSSSSSPSSTPSPACKKLPVEALILDSTPGTTASLTRLANGVARALPPRTPGVVAKGLAAGVVGVSSADEVVWWRDVHQHGVESAQRAGLAGGGNPGEKESGGDGEKTDVGGVGSLMVRFKRTEHCAHAKGVINGTVYWSAVRRTWEMRVDGGMGLRMGLGRRLSLDSLCLPEDDDEEEWW